MQKQINDMGTMGKGKKKRLKIAITALIIATVAYFACTYGYEYYTIKIQKVELKDSIHIHNP